MTRPPFSPGDKQRAEDLRRRAGWKLDQPCFACVAERMGSEPHGRMRERLLERTGGKTEHVCGDRGRAGRDQFGAMIYGDSGAA